MNELEKLREWQMEASRVLSILYDVGWDESGEEWSNVEQDVKLLLEQAPLHYRRLR
jgi:hypothetical protein